MLNINYIYRYGISLSCFTQHVNIFRYFFSSVTDFFVLKAGEERLKADIQIAGIYGSGFIGKIESQIQSYFYIAKRF